MSSECDLPGKSRCDRVNHDHNNMCSRYLCCTPDDVSGRLASGALSIWVTREVLLRVTGACGGWKTNSTNHRQELPCLFGSDPDAAVGTRHDAGRQVWAKYEQRAIRFSAGLHKSLPYERILVYRSGAGGESRPHTPSRTKHFECSASAIPPHRPSARSAYRRLLVVTENETSTQSPRRVVVAEDESLIRLDIVETLRDNGFDVVGEASDGEAAVPLATQLRPDLVIMDVKMPLLDGISAAERLSKARIAPVVLLTAFSQKELVERASEAGALAYVVKPFTPNDLLPAIEIALARHAQIIALETEVTALVERFETRTLVDRAKGLLNEKRGLSEPAAFRWIQKASMDRRLTKKDGSQPIIEQLATKKERGRHCVPGVHG